MNEISRRNKDYMYNFERHELFMDEGLNKKIDDVMQSITIRECIRSLNYLEFHHADREMTFDLDDLEMFRKYDLPVLYVNGSIAVCEHCVDMMGYFNE